MPGDLIEDRIELTGMSTTDDGNVHYRLKLAGTVVAQGIATGGTDGVWAPFSASIEFTNDCCVEMLLEVYEVSANGVEMNLVSIPLTYPEQS